MTASFTAGQITQEGSLLGNCRRSFTAGHKSRRRVHCWVTAGGVSLLGKSCRRVHCWVTAGGVSLLGTNHAEGFTAG